MTSRRGPSNDMKESLMPDPIHLDDAITLHHGDALAWLTTLDTASVDAVVTDPLRVTKPGGVLIMFCDWRQLASATDAAQSGGWVTRGIVPWIKPDSRPQLGRFTQNSEFVVWGSNGAMPIEGECLPGYYLARTPRANEGRVHITQKPVGVVRSLVRIAPPGGLVIDPFAGSATTGVACIHEGRRFAGCEGVAEIHATALQRLAIAGGEAVSNGEQGALDFGDAGAA